MFGRPTRLAASRRPLLAIVLCSYGLLCQLQRASSNESVTTAPRLEPLSAAADESANITVVTGCVQHALGAVAASCGALDVTGQSQNLYTNTALARDDPRSVRVTVSSLIHACIQLGDETSGVRRLRVIAAFARIFPVFDRLGAQFSAATGIPLYFNYTTVLGSNSAALLRAMAAPPPVRDTTDESGGVDAIITVPTFMPLLAQAGKLLDISKLVESDLQLKWFEISNTLRSQMVVYGNKIVAIPVTTSPTLLLYHAPTFKRDGLQVPVTWDQVLALAEAYKGKDINGDGEPDYGICLTPPNCFADGVLLRWVFSSFVLTQGSSQGMFFDSASMVNLANSSAMAEALMVLRRLRLASGQPRGDCTKFEVVEYLQGRCLLALTTHMTFKAAYSPDSPSAYAAMRGNMGMTGFPGSTRVLDRATGQMVDCDETICPLAYNKAPDAKGVVRLVNQPVPSSNVIVLINAQSPFKYQFYAYSLFSYLTSPHVLGREGEALLLDPRLETAPLRNTDVTPESAALWVAHGYHPSDVDHFFTAWRAAQGNPNQAFEPRFPGAPNVSSAFAAAAALYVNTTPGYQLPPVAVPLSIISRTVEAVIVEQGGQETFTRAYRQTLNWVPPPPPPQPMGDGDHVDNARRARTIAPAVVSCGLLLLVSLAMAALWRRKLKGRQLHALIAPGQGLDTTILVTEIQSSTSLWEHLDAGIMDEALSVHHAVMRTAIMKWEGYESLTEGDSFIVAFSNPTAALNCAIEAQQALVDAPWPRELLFYPPLPGLEGDEDPLLQVAAQPLGRQSKASVRRPRGGVGSTAGGQRLPPTNLSSHQEAMASALRSQQASLSFSRHLSAIARLTNGSEGQFQVESTGSNSGGSAWHWQLGSNLADAEAPPTSTLNPHRSTARDMPLASQPDDPHSVQLRDGPSAVSADLRSAVRLDAAAGEAATTQTLASNLAASMQLTRYPGGIREPQPPACANDPDDVPPSGSSIPNITTAAVPASSSTSTVLLFRGMRVRMGMWTGVGAAEVMLNPTSGRMQYSGECMRMAKAVSDTAHGGMVVLTEASRVRLDPVAVRSFQHVILYGGLHALNLDGDANGQLQLHLYTVYSRRLLPRAVVVRPLRTAGELRPGALAAPVGHGALVQMKVAGAGLLLAWNAEVTAAALSLLHDAALALLPCMPTDSSVAGGGCGSAYIVTGCASLLPESLAASSRIGAAPGVMAVVFPDADGAVSWAAAVRRAALELEWPPELLEHELAEEVWAYPSSGTGLGDGARTGATQQQLARSAAAPLSSKTRPWEASGASGVSSLESLGSHIVASRLRERSHRIASRRSRTLGSMSLSGIGALSRLRIRIRGASQLPNLAPGASPAEAASRDGARGAGRRAFSQSARTLAQKASPSAEAANRGPPASSRSPAGDSGGGAAAAEARSVEYTAPAAGLSATGNTVSELETASEVRVEVMGCDEERLREGTFDLRPGPANAPSFPTRAPRCTGPLVAAASPVAAPVVQFSTAVGASNVVALPKDPSDTTGGGLGAAPDTKGSVPDALSSRNDGGFDGGLNGSLRQPEPVLVPRLLYRGLRLRWGVACGPLKGGLAAGDVSGQVSYGGKAAVAAAKLASRARAGQICATAELARALPAALAAELTVVDKL